MKLQVMKCPNCDAALSIDDGLDTFFCKYCGHKIVLSGMDKEVVRAKVKVKGMEHEERLQDKRYSQQRYKMEKESKETNAILIGALSVFAAIFLIIGGIVFYSERGVVQESERLEALVDEIMIDIENGDYATAYIKAESLYWDNGYTDREKEKWEATRKTVIKQIQEAEKKDNPDEGWDLLDWLGL